MPSRREIKVLRHGPLILAVVVALCSTGCGRKKQATDSNSPSPGSTVVFDSLSKFVSDDALGSMQWQDVAPTAESCVRHGLIEEVLKVSSPITAPPVIYLRGLLKFSQGDFPGATEEWAQLDTADIPPDHLYAPWRLISSGDSGQTGKNRYHAPLDLAVTDGRTSRLVEARFRSASGEWRDALEAYLLTDPSSWSSFEVKTFAIMKLQASCTREVEILLSGALAGGKVPESLQLELARLIRGIPQPDREALAATLASDPVLTKAATAGAAKALDLRQAFASNQFQKVVAHVRTADPLQSTDETVLLAFLSAAQIKDSETIDRWAGELRRRNPDKKTQQWIEQIKAEAR